MSSLRDGAKMKLDRELSMPVATSAAAAAADRDLVAVSSSQNAAASRLRCLSRTFSLLSPSSSSLSSTSFLAVCRTAPVSHWTDFTPLLEHASTTFAFSFCYSALVEMQSIMLSVCVCVCVSVSLSLCLSAHISQASDLLCMLPVAD